MCFCYFCFPGVVFFLAGVCDVGIGFRIIGVLGFVLFFVSEVSQRKQNQHGAFACKEVFGWLWFLQF